MVKPLNRTVRNDICFIYRNQASEDAGLKENSEIRVIDVLKNGNYIIMNEGERKEIKRVSAKLVIVYE